MTIHNQPTYADRLQSLASGTLIATTHNLYFLGGINTKRIPYAAIVSVSPSEEGIGVTQENGTFHIFLNVPGLLASTLIVQLARRGQSLEDIPAAGYMGVQATDVELDANTEGVLLHDVISGSPARDAHLQQGDIIQMIGGCHIQNNADLSRFLVAHPPGETVSFTVFRDGKLVTGHLTLGTRPEE